MGFGGYEWINDWYAADYYAHSPTHNPKGPQTGEKKVVRSSFYVDRRSNMTMSRNAYPLNMVLDFQDGSRVFPPFFMQVRCVANVAQPLTAKAAK